MTLLLVALASAACSALLWRASRETFRLPTLLRRNIRGVDVPVAAGVVLALSVVTVEAVLVVLDIGGATPSAAERSGRWLVLVTGLGFGLLGLFDDLAAAGDDRGFRGHLAALASGRLTTGGIKLLGGGLLALIVVGATDPPDLVHLAIGALLVALSANLGNLFDRAPGRCTKVALVLGVLIVVLAAWDGHQTLVGMGIVIGAAAGLLVFDLREELMLGDAGSNILGAVLGLSVVLTSGVQVQSAVLVGVAALNVFSEWVSFSSVIDGNRPLRWFDQLGRRSAP